MTMHLIAAPVAVAIAAVAWLAVQRAWIRSFPETGAETDALAARRGGNSCHTHCDEPCEPGAGAACASSREE